MLILVIISLTAVVCEDVDTIPGPGQYCCQSVATPQDPGLCPTNTSCVIADLDGSVTGSVHCQVTDDIKYENYYNRSEETIFDCMVANWDDKDSFDETDQLPFYIEMFPAMINDTNYVGLDLRMHYIEFMTARFRIMNLNHCGNPFQDISPTCDPRCVRINKTDKVLI